MGQQHPPPDWHWHSLDERELECLYGGDDEVAAGCALVELRRRHDTARLRQASCECGGDRELSKEALQQLDAILWEKRKKYKPERGRWISWARRVLHNIIIDLLRRGTRDKDVPPPEPIEEDSPEREAKRQELEQVMKGCLHQLSSEERTALILRFWQDLTYEEIARERGILVVAAWRLVRHATEKMRDCLKRKGYEGGEL
jgi:RNA polymerase sigma-70 factor (ECF subfamily)